MLKKDLGIKGVVTAMNSVLASDDEVTYKKFLKALNRPVSNAIKKVIRKDDEDSPESEIVPDRDLKKLYNEIEKIGKKFGLSEGLVESYIDDLEMNMGDNGAGRALFNYDAIYFNDLV